MMFRYIYLFLGVLFTIVGVVGIFVPLLPTTPLLLAAIYFFTHSSPRLQKAVLQNRFLKTYVDPYIRNTPILLKTRIRTIILLWLTLFVSGYFMHDNEWVLIVLGLVGIGVTAHVLMVRRGCKESVE